MAALTDRHARDGSKCKIFAFDKNPQRARLLKQRMNDAGAQKIVEVSNEDFLEVDVRNAKYKSVSCVLLDPSCSGSGVARVLERVLERQGDQSAITDKQLPVDIRLGKLRTFQLAALRKAMSFPSVEFVVYSTCSIHKEENESVVAEVLSSAPSSNISTDAIKPNAVSPSWTVIEPSRLKKWKRRGEICPGLDPELQDMLIRCHPSDGLNGFFVAVFKKLHSDCAAGAPLSLEPEQTALSGNLCTEDPQVSSMDRDDEDPTASSKRKRLSDYSGSTHSKVSAIPVSSKVSKGSAARETSGSASARRATERPFFKKLKKKTR